MKKAFLFSIIFVLIFTTLILLSVFYLRMMQMNELDLAQSENITRVLYVRDDIANDLLDYLQLSINIRSSSANTILNISDTLPSPYSNPLTALNAYKSFINGMYSNQTNLLDPATNLSVVSLNTTAFQSTPSIQFINSNSSLNLNYSYNNLSKNELIINGSSLVRNYSITVTLNDTCLNSNCTNATWAGGALNPDSSTRGLWHFDEGSGTTTADSSGNGNTAQLSGTPTWAGGRFKAGLQFIYSDLEQLIINDSESLDITGNLTIELWFKTIPIGAYGWILNKCNVSLSYTDDEYSVYITPANKIICQIANGTAFQYVMSTAAIQSDTWYHLACTANGSNLTMYINGLQDNSTPQTLTPTPNDYALFIGAQNDQISLYHFNGTIDDVAIYSRAKSADEIAADANLFHWDWGTIAMNSNISAAWHFDETSGVDAYDSSGNGNTVVFNSTQLMTLYPSSTHKAYLISSTTTDSAAQATTEFSSAQYTSISTSNDVYVTSTAQETIGASCNSPTGDSYCQQDAEGSCEPCEPLGTCSAPSPHCTAPTQTASLGDTCSWRLEASCACRARGTICIELAFCGVLSGSCTYTCNSSYYDANGLDSDGCETTTPAYIYTFQRYTFNLLAYTWNDVNELDFCFEGKYASTGGTASANLQWYNVTASAWVNATAISTTEGTVCITFSGANRTDVYNSTGTWVQFAARGNQSKQGYTNTLSGDYAYLSISYTNPTAPWIIGKSGNGISLNGTGVYGEANDSASLGITGQLTLEAWVNPSTVTPTYQTIVHKGTSPAENYGLYLEQGELYFEWINSGARSIATTSANMQNNTWYHVAAVFNYSGNSVKLYVNGTQMASSSTSSDLLTDIGVLRIGANSSAGNYFNGTIDDVAIYSRAKSADEIAADANPIYVSTAMTDSLGNSISIRGSTSGYVNPSTNNTVYLKTNSGSLNMTAGAYSGAYSLRAYVNNTKATMLTTIVEAGASSIQAVIPIQLKIYNQTTFDALVIAEK